MKAFAKDYWRQLVLFVISVAVAVAWRDTPWVMGIGWFCAGMMSGVVIVSRVFVEPMMADWEMVASEMTDLLDRTQTQNRQLVKELRLAAEVIKSQS